MNEKVMDPNPRESDAFVYFDIQCILYYPFPNELPHEGQKKT